MLVPRSSTDEQLRNFIDPDIFPGLGVSGFRGLALAGVVGSAVSLFDVRILYFILVLQWGLGKAATSQVLDSYCLPCGTHNLFHQILLPGIFFSLVSSSVLYFSLVGYLVYFF